MSFQKFKVEIYSESDDAWNLLISNFIGVTIFQSAEWGRYCEAAFNDQIYKLIFFDGDGHLVGACLVRVDNNKSASWQHGPLLKGASSNARG